MKQSINVWGIKEFEGDGVSCPIVPTNLPWYKKIVLTFFRFGVCPLCITLSLTYSIGKFFRKIFMISKPPGRQEQKSASGKFRVNNSKIKGFEGILSD